MLRILLASLVFCLVAACTAATNDSPSAAPAAAPAAGNPVVIMDTAMGKVKIELFPDKAPITVANFLKYVDAKHYDGMFFHRIIPDFMIQGGGYKPGFDEPKSGEPIKNESTNGVSNARGTIAMARQRDADSAKAQFFINVKDNSRSCDQANAPDKVGYCVFGRVLEGMDVVDKIRFVETGAVDGMMNVPKDQASVVIKSIRRAEK